MEISESLHQVPTEKQLCRTQACLISLWHLWPWVALLGKVKTHLRRIIIPLAPHSFPAGCSQIALSQLEQSRLLLPSSQPGARQPVECLWWRDLVLLAAQRYISWNHPDGEAEGTSEAPVRTPTSAHREGGRSLSQHLLSSSPPPTLQVSVHQHFSVRPEGNV